MVMAAKNFTDLITCTRAGTATRVNPSGLIESVAANQPRFDYDPVTLAVKGLLVEESRTNLLVNSERFDRSGWVRSSTTIAPSSIVAPDGVSLAMRFADMAATASHDMYQAYSGTANSYVTFSIFIRAGELSKLKLSVATASLGDGGSVEFDLIAGAITGTYNHGAATGTVGYIYPFPNGWYRCCIAAKPTITGNWYPAIVLENVQPYAGSVIYTGNGASGLYLWGAQLEAGSFPTSYIPTPTAFTSRASTATFMGSNGLIQTAAINTARTDYEPIINLLPYSQQLDQGAWVANAAQVTASTTTATVAPDGSNSAYKLAETATSAVHVVSQNASITSGVVYTLSIYAKASERSWIQLLGGATAFGSNVWANFNLSGAGSIGSVGSAASNVLVQSLGNGWYRCSLTATAIATGSNPGTAISLTNDLDWNVRVPSYQGVAGSGAYVWGAQLNVGALQPYQSTGSTLAPKSKGALYEAAATNLLLYSEQFDNSAWAKIGTGGCTISANAAIAPDGTTTADKLIASTTAGTHFLRQTVSLQANTTYVFSMFVKAAEVSSIRLYLFGASAGVAFDALTGAFSGVSGTLSQYSATQCGNGWWRVSITATSGGTAPTTHEIYTADNNAGNGTSGIYIWGAQLELAAANNLQTSYIPTTTASATRSADVTTSASVTRNFDAISIDTLSPWYRSDEGTVVVSAKSFGVSAGSSAGFVTLGVGSTTTNRLAQIDQISAGTVRGAVYDSAGTNQALINLSGATVGQQIKAALAYKQGNVGFSINGGAVSSNTTAVVNAAPTKVFIGGVTGVNSQVLNGWVSKIDYYPIRKSNADLQALST